MFLFVWCGLLQRCCQSTSRGSILSPAPSAASILALTSPASCSVTQSCESPQNKSCASSGSAGASPSTAFRPWSQANIWSRISSTVPSFYRCRGCIFASCCPVADVTPHSRSFGRQLAAVKQDMGLCWCFLSATAGGH